VRVALLSTTSLAQVLRRAVSESPTYSEHGATLSGNGLPAGYHHDRYDIGLGTGRGVFERAVDGLRSWQAHHLPGVSVYPPQAEIETGNTVLVCLGKGVAIVAPCRIVAVVEKADRWGFAYGTLPGHPERGEEAFVISLSSDDSVHFDITAFSRPADRLVRLAGPLGRAVQQKATDEYLRSMRRYMNG
jgi:uncharacterized protein (UPF0548 family)